MLNTDFLSEKKGDKEPFVWTVKTWTWTKEITRANQKSICQFWLDSFNLNYFASITARGIKESTAIPDFIKNTIFQSNHTV